MVGSAYPAFTMPFLAGVQLKKRSSIPKQCLGMEGKATRDQGRTESSEFRLKGECMLLS